MRRSIRKRSRTSDPTNAPSISASVGGLLRGGRPRAVYAARVHTLPATNQPWRAIRGGFTNKPGAPARRRPPRRPERQQIILRRALALGAGPADPDPDRARRQRLPQRPQAAGAQRLRTQRHPDRRRDEADEQGLLRQALRPRRTLGHRVRRRGQCRPQRNGQLREPHRQPLRARRHGTGADAPSRSPTSCAAGR